MLAPVKALPLMVTRPPSNACTVDGWMSLITGGNVPVSMSIGNGLDSTGMDGIQTKTLPSIAVAGIVTSMRVPPPLDGTLSTTPGMVPVLVVLFAVNFTRLPVAAKLLPVMVRTPPMVKDPDNPLIEGLLP